MKTSLASLLLLLIGIAPLGAQTNLLGNGSFETGTNTQGFTETFVDPNNSIRHYGSGFGVAIDNWESGNSIRWINDSTRTTDGNRSIYIDPTLFTGSGDPCEIQNLPVHVGGDCSQQIVPGETYRLEFDYAVFNPSDPTAVHTGNTANGGVADFFGEFITTDSSGAKQYFRPLQINWVNSGSLAHTKSWTELQDPANWNRASVDFTVPNDPDMVQLTVAMSVDDASPTGVMFDNASFVGLCTVPEPSGALLAGLAGIFALASRRGR